MRDLYYLKELYENILYNIEDSLMTKITVVSNSNAMDAELNINIPDEFNMRYELNENIISYFKRELEIVCNQINFLKGEVK